MGILLCSRTFFEIQGVLYPASIVTNSTSENFSVYGCISDSYATLSLTFPAVTSTPNTIPCLSQAVCASYANCRSCAPFTNIPQSGSVLDTVSNCSSSGTSLIFVIIVIVDLLTQFFSFLGYLFAKLFLGTPSRLWRPVPSETSFLFADALIWVPSIKIMLGSTIRLFSALFKICAKISSPSSGRKRLQKA